MSRPPRGSAEIVRLPLSVFSPLASALLRGALEPVPVMRRPKAGIISGNEALIVHFYAEIARIVVSDHLPRIVRCTKELPDKFVLPELIGPGNLDHAVHRLCESDIGYRGRDVIRNHGLH